MKKNNKIDKPLAKLNRGLRDSIQINKIRNEKRDITTDTEEIQRPLGLTSKACTSQNWKIKMKWMIFLDKYLSQDFPCPITLVQRRSVIGQGKGRRS